MNRLSSGILSLLVAGVVLLHVNWYSNVTAELERTEERSRITEQAAFISQNIHNTLNARLQLVMALVALQKSHQVFDREFQRFAHELAATQKGIRSLQYAKDGIVSHVYPIKGNEAVLGHNLLVDPKRSDVAYRSILTKEFVIAGPLNLIQGGRALIGRYPIYTNPPASGKELDEFWGFATILIDVEPLFEESGLNELSHKLSIAIRGRDGLGAEGSVFFGNPEIFNANPVLTNITLPNGSWQLAAIPIRGWLTSIAAYRLLWSIGFIVAFISSMLAYVLLRRPAVLKEKIKKAIRHLEKSENDYRQILDGIKNEYFIYRHNLDGVYDYLSPSIKNLLGYSANDFIFDQNSLLSDHPDNANIAEQTEKTISSRSSQSFSVVLKHKDGSDRIFDILESPVFSDDKTIIGVQGIARDVTDKRASRVRQMRSQAMFENTDEAIIITNSANEIISVNPAFVRITGYTEEEILGLSPSTLSSGRQGPEFYRNMWSSIQKTGSWNGEIWNRRKNGEFFPEWLSISTIRDDNEKILNYIAIFRDITKQKRDADMITKQATTDALTGLPNRLLFMDRLTQVIASCQRDKHLFAVIHIDLDHFKYINDTLGHSVGDSLLIEASERLKSCVRNSDTVSRLSSDEFVVLLRNIHEIADAESVVQKILQKISEVYILGNEDLYITCSIGIALYPLDDEKASDLMAHADMAMYRAKELGRNTYQFFTVEMDERIQNVSNLKSRLRKAINLHEFEAYYQPIVSARSGMVTKAEALVRWIDPDQGFLPPDEFIPIAEDTGLIVPIGVEMLRQVCRDLPNFQATSEHLENLAINSSVRELKEPEFVNNFAAIMKEAKVSTNSLVLEITESLFIDTERSSAISNIQEIKRSGIKTALDDFGTGYSSLSYLQRFPAEYLKIDKSFISDLEMNEDSARLVDTIIKMAHGFRMEVIAEGVETKEQMKMLQEMECDYLQGYLFSRPLRKEAFIDFLKHDCKIGGVLKSIV